MKYKILILKNKLRNIQIEDDVAKMIDFFKRKTPLEIEVDYKDVDFTNLEHSMYLNKLGHSWWGLKDIKKRIRKAQLFLDGEYDVCIFAYDMTDTQAVRDGKYVTSWTNFSPLYTNTGFIQLASKPAWDNVNDIYRVLTHELLHELVREVRAKGETLTDAMDVTLVNGKVEPYYKEFEIEAPDGNRARTIANLSPFWDLIEKPIKPIKPIKSQYKHFSQKEVDFLKVAPKLMYIVDLMRDVAETPFIGTSGLRTPKHNKEVGGVANSAHLKGLAIDFRIRSNKDLTKMLYGISVIRKDHPVFLEITKSHLHLDIDNSIHSLEDTIIV